MERVNGEERAPLLSPHGVPALPRDSREAYQKQLAVYLILASTLFERIAFYSIAATLSVAADPTQCPSQNGPIVSLIFTGTSNFCTLIFAVFSDWRLGRGKTILIGFSFYLIGYTLMTIFTSGSVQDCLTKDTDTSKLFTGTCEYYIYPALIIIAIGASAVQCNLSVLGGEQFQDIPDVSRYFDKYVVAVNIGSIFAKLSFYFAALDSIQYHYAFVYGISALTVSFILFLIGYRYYLHMKSTETIVIKFIPVIINAFRSWYQHRRNNRTNTNGEDFVGKDREEERRTLLDFAKIENQGKFVERTVNEVKSLRDALIVFILLIPYWLIYDQLNSTFRLQATHMRETGTWSMIAVSLFDPVVLIAGILIINIFIYRLIAAQQRLLSITMKFIIGMCIAIVTMIIAGSIEDVRQNSWTLNANTSNLTIYAQIPQIFSMGASELFVMVASFEFAFLASPRSAQTFFMSLRFCSIGMSSFLGAAYISLYEIHNKALDFSCREDDEYRWRFPAYFFILGAIQFIFLLIFIGCQKKYKLIQLNRQQIRSSQLFRH